MAPLKRMSDDEAEGFLKSLPEVNTKTGRCVLMYALGKPVFPVDGHCFRIAQRLGWVAKDVTLTERQADALQILLLLEEMVRSLPFVSIVVK